MTTHNLISGDVIIFKGGKWSKYVTSLFKRDFWRYYALRPIIQVITLSRYTHSATLIQGKNRWYIVQSTCLNGIVKEVVDMNWIETQITNNNIDVFRDSKFNSEDFEQRLKPLLGKKYSYLGLINIGIYNITGLSPFKNDDKYFCSELTSYLHNLKINGKPSLNSPADIANSDEVRKII